MSLDLLDRLISDIVSVTQTLMSTDASDLSAMQPSAAGNVEKDHMSLGKRHEHRAKHGSRRPMSEGVHRSVC